MKDALFNIYLVKHVSHEHSIGSIIRKIEVVMYAFQREYIALESEITIPELKASRI